MKEEIIKKLIEEAKEIAKRNFCCKYSNFSVGAALLTKEGKVYKGCNIENDGIQSICAERTAFVKALSEGNKEFVSIAIIGYSLKTEEFTSIVPCGYCRQFLKEYTNSDFLIYSYEEKEDKIITFRLEELLPHSFDMEREEENEF